MKLEKIEIGGVRGKTLQERMMNIYDEFNKKFSELSVNYEMLVPEDETFDKNKQIFLDKVFY